MACGGKTATAQRISLDQNEKYLITEDSKLLTSVSDATVCRAMASRAANCFFLRLFRLWEGDHSCGRKMSRKSAKGKSLLSEFTWGFQFLVMISMQIVFYDTVPSTTQGVNQNWIPVPCLFLFPCLYLMTKQNKKVKAFTCVLQMQQYFAAKLFYAISTYYIYWTVSNRFDSLPKQSLLGSFWTFLWAECMFWHPRSPGVCL